MGKGALPFPGFFPWSLLVVSAYLPYIFTMMGRMSSRRVPGRPRSERLEALRLTATESRAFAEALLYPREPIPDLRTAAERYRKMVCSAS